MELNITAGRGYVGADKNKKDDQAVGVIPIDSLYTPVRRVNFTVENTRVGQITDYDKLTLEVWTQGDNQSAGSGESGGQGNERSFGIVHQSVRQCPQYAKSW